MALDIFITDSHGNIEKSIPLRYEDYDTIMSLIESDPSFSLLKRVLADYYGDGEVYLNELENLKKEILAFKEQFKSHYPEGVLAFLDKGLDIIDYAIRTRKTIKFAGD